MDASVWAVEVVSLPVPVCLAVMAVAGHVVFREVCEQRSALWRKCTNDPHSN